MDNGAGIQRWPKAVLLSRDVSLTEQLRASSGDGFAVVQTDNPYQAAAEVLAQHATHLIVDLKVMKSRHAGLLLCAQQAGASVLAVGPIPAGMTSDDLAGARMVARARLAEAVFGGSTAAPAPAERQERLSPSRTADIREPETGEADEPPADSAPPANVAEGEPAAEKDNPAPSDRREGTYEKEFGSRKGGINPANLLTPQELSALLGREPRR